MSQIAPFLATRSLLLPFKVIALAYLSLGMSLPAQALTFFTEDNPPLNYPGSGKVTGIASEVVTEMARRAKVDADIQLLPWTESYSRALSEADACVFSTARTSAR